jgi:8-oxo-dGTP pyrophosphatase MutT (NUDIX family)
MKRYVLGFAFSEDKSRVVLIRKNGNSVPAHAGKLNGVGGKIEPSESSFEAMEREFREETGVVIPKDQWRYRGMFSGEGWNVKVFCTATEATRLVRTVESEEIFLASAANLAYHYALLCPHVLTLVRFCLDDSIKKFNFEEVMPL